MSIVQHHGMTGGRIHTSSKDGTEANKSGYDRDRAALARSGKKQVLQRNFGLVSMIGFTCSLMTTWEGVLVSFLLGFQNGGPAGLIYGFIFVGLGTLSVFTTLGELASMTPTAGGQYHWVNLLAPNNTKKFLSYVIGWLTVAGWIAALASAMNFSTSLIQALAVLNFPDYVPTGWQGTLIYWAVLLFCVCVNTMFSKLLPAIEILVLILHIMGFFAILVPLVYLSPLRNSPRDIFTTFLNEGGWPTQGLAFFIGLNGNAGAFIGTDGAVHMSEEVKSAEINVPRSMVYSVILNGLLGFGILIAFLLCADFESAATSGSAMPFITILASATGSSAGAVVMAVVVLVLTIFAGVGVLASASRMMWSFARDRGLPGWTVLSKINSRTTIPLASISVVASMGAVLGLINIGSATAFADTLSLLLEALYTSYLLVCALLLYRRIAGHIGSATTIPTPDAAVKEARFQEWGPWHVPGIWGIVNNAFACVYLTVLCFFSFWPETSVVTADSMNYSILVTGFVAVSSVSYYFLWGHRSYSGPTIEMDPRWEMDVIRVASQT